MIFFKVKAIGKLGTWPLTKEWVSRQQAELGGRDSVNILQDQTVKESAKSSSYLSSESFIFHQAKQNDILAFYTHLDVPAAWYAV